MENATKTVLLCGVGGQGTILAADLLAGQHALGHFHEHPEIPLGLARGVHGLLEHGRAALAVAEGALALDPHGWQDSVGYTSDTQMKASLMPVRSPRPRKRVRLGIDTAQLLWALQRKSIPPLESSRNIFTVW